MTDDEMDELFALIDTIGVPPWRKRLAIDRLRAKGYLVRDAVKSVAVTQEALTALGKMRMA